MTQEFLMAVRSIVEPLLTELGFQLDEYVGDIGASDKKGSAVIFRSEDCKIQVYDSRRNGDINCMIAPLAATNTFGPYDSSGVWQYIALFAIKAGVSNEELMNDQLSSDFPTTNERLEWVRGRIHKYYPVAHEGILKIAAPVGESLEDRINTLQVEIDQLSADLGVRTMPVGLRTNNGLNIYVADDGSYHFTSYERGELGFDRVGSLDDLLYWYCKGVVRSQAAKLVGDRKERFKYEYEVLSDFNVAWAKRRVRELAAMFRNGQPQDIALLPDIGEPL